jgi:pimeloyl-ACP methyl ester carboxylesterase/DNA-binding CsgD family transcriptional regulator
MTQEIRFCRTPDGVRIAYATAGRGAPIVKAANWLSHLELDWMSPVWRHEMTELSRDHTLVRYDVRSCGLSDREVPELSFDAWVRDLETVVDAAGCETFALLGISQGAATAIAYAAAHPERVSHLVLHGGYTRGRLRRDPTPAQRDEVELMMKLAEIGWGRDNPAFRQFFTVRFIPDGSREQQSWFNELERASTSAENAVRFMRVLWDIDVSDRAPRVACPTLVLHATRDEVVPFDEGRRLATLIPHARFVPLDTRNHLLLEQEPAWRRWCDEVRAFLPRAALGAPAFAELTQRERDLVELIAQGRDNAQIAAVLSLSPKTVRNHITSIFAKLGVENRSQAIVRAREAGFGRRDA